MLFMNKHHKVSFSDCFIFDRIMRFFGDFIGKGTLCDAYHKEQPPHYPAFLDTSDTMTVCFARK